MRLGLLFVCARAVAHQPHAAPVKALRTALAHAGRRLKFYQKLPADSQKVHCLLGLSVVGHETEAEVRSFSSLPPLPPLDSLLTEESIKREESPPLSTGGVELPVDLRPELQEDDLPTEDDLESDNVDDCPDEVDYDALDLKNMPDYDPNQDDDAEFYREGVVNGWILSDDQQCSRGPKPRLYELVHVSNETKADTYSPDYDPSPLDESSTLSSHLLVLQVPALNDSKTNTTDTDFTMLFKSYAYLTSSDNYKRVNVFRQEDPGLPRWLLVQEFTSLDSLDWSLKKKEVEYWWRKNGWEGVLAEFFVEAPEGFGWTQTGPAT